MHCTALGAHAHPGDLQVWPAIQFNLAREERAKRAEGVRDHTAQLVIHGIYNQLGPDMLDVEESDPFPLAGRASLDERRMLCTAT